MAGPGAFITSDSMQQAAPKLEQQSSLVGNTWGQKSNALDVLKANRQSSNIDCLPPDPFGDIDGQLLALKTDEQMQRKNPKSVSGVELIKTAEKLGHDPHRWESSTTGKCNQFVEAVLTAKEVPFPWKAGQSDCHSMRQALDKECSRQGSMWEKVYNYDPSHGLESDKRFANFQPNDGDIVIWDKVWGNQWVQHAGIASEPYNILYAGARDPGKHGFGKTDIYNFTGHPPYGSPSAVYRYKGLRSDH
jgi:hypothetical protein